MAAVGKRPATVAAAAVAATEGKRREATVAVMWALTGAVAEGLLRAMTEVMTGVAVVMGVGRGAVTEAAADGLQMGGGDGDCDGYRNAGGGTAEDGGGDRGSGREAAQGGGCDRGGDRVTSGCEPISSEPPLCELNAARLELVDLMQGLAREHKTLFGFVAEQLLCVLEDAFGMPGGRCAGVRGGSARNRAKLGSVWRVGRCIRQSGVL